MAKNYTYDYFISYRRACGGKLYALMIQHILCKCGKKVFLDLNDMVMGNYHKQINQAISQSETVILILNKDSWRSQEIDTYYSEIIQAKNENKNILPVEFADNILNNVPKCLQKELGEDYSLDVNQKIKYDYQTFEGELCRKLRITYSYDSQNEKLPRFSMPFVIDDLVARDEKVDELCDKILNNHFYNLVGVGGIGKTTLSYLLTKKYSPLFSKIAYVVVNGHIKEDFASQINATLNLDIAPNVPTDEKYKMVISVMDQYQSENNLLILDVNETADKTAIADYAKKLKNNNLPINKIYPNNWNILILSREKFGRFRYEDLSNDEDKAFLKELFLKRANKNEDDFDDYDGLFGLIKYSPLLAEQLGIYFENQPMPSLEEIKNILYGNLREEEILGTNAHNRDERTLICFLKNLIHYHEFNNDEKIVLSHFALWKSDFLSINIISDLLKGTCRNLNHVLVALAKRFILNYKQKDKMSCYKLHGLLADSLREQIEMEEQYYIRYLGNIERIRDYDFRKFLPYADCIGNSLCEYEITTNIIFLHDTAVKFDNIRKPDYAKQLLERIIKISNQRLENEPENIDYLLSLSYAYNNLASLQGEQLNDYEVVLYFNKAIEMVERIIRISATPIYLNWLTSIYNNLAIWQKKQNFPELAKKNYDNAIEILEKIAESSDNPEYLFVLAQTYYNLAMLQNECLNDSQSAEINYTKAINNGEKIRKISTKPDYLRLLAGAYTNLASLQKVKEKYASAIVNCYNAIKLADIIKDINPEYLIGWMISNYLLAQLVSDPDEVRKIVNELKPIAEKLLEEYPNYGYLKKVYGAIKKMESMLNQ